MTPLLSHISQKLFHNPNASFTSVSGGCINNGGKLTFKDQMYFVKWNDKDRFPGMFEAEMKGLQLLSDQKKIHIPGVVLQDQWEDYSFLVLEWVEKGYRQPDYWENLARQLSELHRVSSNQFGLDHDNFIGSLPQQNQWVDSWTEFFVEWRMIPMVSRARDQGLIDGNWVSKIESLYGKLDNYFPRAKPTLIHGDLWSGNLMVNKKGDPCLIDPAVYFGHREIELSFTRLFGGFDRDFYRAYHEFFPLEAGFEERVSLYNLYPLLVHLNLFGTSYLHDIQVSIKRYL